MPFEHRGNTAFWAIVALLYVVSIAFSFYRVYIKHDYPIFTKVEEIPNVLLPIEKILRINQ